MAVSVEIVQEEATSKKPAQVIVREMDRSLRLWKQKLSSNQEPTVGSITASHS